MVGQVLGGRYELLSRVGGGGMALVYKGHDLLLHRNVAVKVLRQQFVHDEEFIRRFRREAQSAASLSHQSVVSIYDVGQEGDHHYIVMEYVEGMTLNDLIKEKAPLQVEEALHIASQICDALDHAHSNQIIHRDIKPHNILIGKNGRVKVTDFGIARASTSSTITQTGSVVGSVHYFSPEHAKGVSAGAKSDLYSLGIVLYQMLTGRLPFLGESPISVALKHLQENVEEPRNVNPLIPQSVENIILKAMRKNPDERYQSAKEMLHDLETALDPKRKGEPKLIFADDDLDGEETRVIPTIRPDRSAHGNEEGDARHGKRRKNHNPWIAPLVWTVIFLVFLAVMWFEVIPTFKERLLPKDVQVPDVVNMKVVDAENAIKGARLNPEVKRENSQTVERDLVISQEPSGMKVKEGSIVTLHVSSGAEMMVMGDYLDRPFSDVKAELLAAGVPENQITMTETFIDAPEGNIVKQQPEPNTEYDPTKAAIRFTVSKGREKVEMPDLIGLTVAEAEARLLTKGLKLAPGEQGREEVPSFEIQAGRVVDTYPAKKGEFVDSNVELKVFVSSGPPQDAGDYTESLLLKAAKSGKASIFRIVVSDAKHENYDYATMEVADTEPVNVKVTVTKEKNATIQIYRDNAFHDSITVTYQDYLDQKNKPSPTPAPAQSSSGDGSGGTGTDAGGASATQEPAGNTGTQSQGG